MRQNTNVQTGNRIIVEVDGIRLGLIQSAGPSDGYGLEAASGIGDIHVTEWVPTRADHSVRISRMILLTERAKKAGIVPENGDAALKGYEFDVCWYSKDTGKLLRKMIGCVFDSGETDVSAHRITTSNATYRARDVTGLGL